MQVIAKYLGFLNKYIWNFAREGDVFLLFTQNTFLGQPYFESWMFSY